MHYCGNLINKDTPEIIRMLCTVLTYSILKDKCAIVSFPDPDSHTGKGLVTFAYFVGCARSAIA